MLLKRNTQLFQISGSDSRLRLWDVETGCNTLVNFEASRLQTSKAIQLAVSDDSSLVFVPCITAVKVLIAPFFFICFSSFLFHHVCMYMQMIRCACLASREISHGAHLAPHMINRILLL